MGDSLEPDKLETTTEWLKLVFPNGSFDIRELNPVFGFSLLWNLFERIQSKELGKDFEAKHLIKIGQSDFNVISEHELDLIFNHFVNRYFIDETDGPKRFTKLRLEKFGTNMKPFGQSVTDFMTASLRPEQNDLIKRMTAVLLIICRFRNNLFHGAKDTLKLNKFVNEFTVINKFLRVYLAAKIITKP